jgi:hypothetical protein
MSISVFPCLRNHIRKRIGFVGRGMMAGPPEEEERRARGLATLEINPLPGFDPTPPIAPFNFPFRGLIPLLSPLGLINGIPFGYAAAHSAV